MWYLLDENKQPYPVGIEQVTLENISKYKVVQQDTLPNGKFVSTVFLGLDHGWEDRNKPDYKPVLWETMVFSDQEFGADEYMERYSSYEDALEGHKRALDYANIPTE
jgi:hypothetical protein